MFAVDVVHMVFLESEEFLKAKKEGKRRGHTKKFVGMFTSSLFIGC